jgi:hypothetical protein
MDLELSGNGYLETAAGRHPARYYVRSYRERPGGLYDSYGRIEVEDPHLLMRLIIQRENDRLTLVLEDGSKLPILLTSTSGEIRPQGIPEAAHT